MSSYWQDPPIHVSHDTMSSDSELTTTTSHHLSALIWRRVQSPSRSYSPYEPFDY